MKRKYFLILFLIIPFFGISQTLLDSIQNKIEEKLQHLNHSNVPGGILYERIYQKANLTAFSTPEVSIGFPFLKQKKVIKNVIPVSSYYHYFMALDDLERADYLNRYGNSESLYNLNKSSGNTVNIGIINADIATFNNDPIASGALNIVGIDSLLYENPSSSIPLYKKYKNCLVGAALKKEVFSQSINYKVNANFWKETAQNIITSLQIDFGNGQGFRTVTKGQTIPINYINVGEKTLQFKATFSNNNVHTVTSRLQITNAPNLSRIEQEQPIVNNSSCSMPLSGLLESELTFRGYDETQAYAGRGRYRNHSNTSCIDQPVIVVEGYDPKDSFNNFEIYDQLNRSFLGTQIRNSGSDIFTLDFQNHTAPDGKVIRGGSDYIERNAMVLIELINRINANKASNAAPTKIIGFSMGGLVVRYALRFMELNGMTHDTDLYVSVDTPHQGAVVPTGAQYTLDFIDDLVPSWIDDELNHIADDLLLPAPKQMLVHHFASNTSYPDGYQGFHDRFYNTLNTMGYPQQTRNIAVTNGRLDGIGTNSINQKYYEGKMHWFGIILNGKLRLNLTNNSRARVFYWRLKILGITIWKRQRHINSYSNIGSYENAPGGIATIDDLDQQITDFTSFGFDYWVVAVKQNLSSDSFSFLPTKSALDFSADPYLFEDISDENLSCTNKTPFDSYYAPTVNEPHLFLSIDASNFIRQEILGNHQDPSFVVKNQDLKTQSQGGASPCSNNNYWSRLYFPQCKIKQGTTWSVSNPSIITILEQNNQQFRYKAAPNRQGSVTITANIPNQQPVSRTVTIGTDFSYPSGSYYAIDAGGGGFANSFTLADGYNYLTTAPYLSLPNNVLVQKYLPSNWQFVSWQLDADTQNAVHSWSQSNSLLQFNYFSHQENAVIIFKLNAIDNCGNTKTLYFWFKIAPQNANRTASNFDTHYSVFPVPANNYININSKTDKTEISNTIELFDFYGNKVYSGNIQNKKTEINTNSLKEGVYILKINQKNTILTKTITIKK